MARVASSPVWLVGSRFDLLAFFAPAALSMLVFIACVGFRMSPVPWLWVWIFCFDGPHMLAAYTRAYGDPVLWRSRRRLLLGSLAAFLVGPAFYLIGGHDLFTLFLAVMSVYSFQHVVRQHWGFVSIYGARAVAAEGDASRLGHREKLWLYAVCWAPYVAFVLTHPSLRKQAGDISPALVMAGNLAAAALAALWLLGTVRLASKLLVAQRAGRATQPSLYLLLCALFHALVFFVAARFEPIFPNAVGLDEEFMLLSIMNGMFHSGQYVALVGLYHRRSANIIEEPPTWFARRPWLALAVIAPFVALYLFVADRSEVYPLAPWSASRLHHSLDIPSALWLALFWGFALHHYWLDERIWHVRSDARLRKVLAL